MTPGERPGGRNIQYFLNLNYERTKARTAERSLSRWRGRSLIKTFRFKVSYNDFPGPLPLAKRLAREP